MVFIYLSPGFWYPHTRCERPWGIVESSIFLGSGRKMWRGFREKSIRVKAEDICRRTGGNGWRNEGISIPYFVEDGFRNSSGFRNSFVSSICLTAQWDSQFQSSCLVILSIVPTGTVIPTLFPALEQCCRLRPKDPMEYLAFYLMRHADGYNKTLLTKF